MDIHFHDALGIFLLALGQAHVKEKGLGLQRFHPADAGSYFLGIFDCHSFPADGLEARILPNPDGAGHQPQQFSGYPVSDVNIRAPFRTLAKRELLKVPIMGFIFKTSGIMVDRSSPESRKASFQRMVEAVTLGESLMIYPEGTQNRTNEQMQPFFDGAFKLAVATQVPILPVVTINTRRTTAPEAKFGRSVPEC